jgi:hypothetical protein
MVFREDGTLGSKGTTMKDAEKVNVVERLAEDVATGRVSTTQQIESVLKPLGADVGPFGGASFELDVALEKLRRAAASKGLALF